MNPQGCTCNCSWIIIVMRMIYIDKNIDMFIENCVNLINFTFSRQLSSLNDFIRKNKKKSNRSEYFSSCQKHGYKIFTRTHVFKIIHLLTNMYIVYHVLIIISKGISVSFWCSKDFELEKADKEYVISVSWYLCDSLCYHWLSCSIFLHVHQNITHGLLWQVGSFSYPLPSLDES